MQNIKEYVAEKKLKLAEEVKAMDKKPKLVIIQIGDNPASQAYVKGKIADCIEVGIPYEHLHYAESFTEAELLAKINELNADTSTTAFIVQLPLPKHISEEKVIEAIKPEKDVDGFSKKHIVEPATPIGIIEYLEDQNFKFDSKNAVILGRSNIVGKPLHNILLNKNMNVINLHTHTSAEDKRFYISHADLILSATGHRNSIDVSYDIKSSAVVIDFGMERNDEGKICGDIEQDLNVAFQNHNPGSTGLTTRLALITNLIKLYKMQ